MTEKLENEVIDVHGIFFVDEKPRHIFTKLASLEDHKLIYSDGSGNLYTCIEDWQDDFFGVFIDDTERAFYPAVSLISNNRPSEEIINNAIKRVKKESGNWPFYIFKDYSKSKNKCEERKNE